MSGLFGTRFLGTSSGGTSRQIVLSGGGLDFTGLTSSGTTIGSLEGAGTVAIGSKTLSIGLNNLSTTFSGVIQDIASDPALTRGSLTKTGSGSLTLSGVNTYTGPTAVNSGSLIVNGSIANSTVSVGVSGTLGGSGTVGSTTVLGTISPGNSPGTLTVAGNLTFGAGSVYLAEVQGPVADRINVTGSASLAGTLRIVPLGGPYSFGTPYTLLSAAAGRTGTFDTVTSTSAAVLPTITYDPTSVFLTLRPGLLTPLLPAGAASNPVAIAAGFDRAVAGGADPSAFFALYNLPAASLPGALNTLSGEVQTGASGAVQSAADRFLATLLDPTGQGRLGQCIAVPAGGKDKAGKEKAGCDPRIGGIVSVWGAAYGGDRRVGGSAATGAASRHDQVWGLATGLDVRLDEHSIIGVAASGGQANASLALGRGSADADLGQFGIYGLTQRGPFSLSGALAYSFAGAHTRRNVTLFNGNRLTSSPDLDGVSGRIEAAYKVLDWRSIALSGTAAFQAQSIGRDGTAERGANPAALTTAGNDALTARTELGLKAEYRSGDVTAFGRLAWAHYEANEADLTASFQALPAAGFRINGARLCRNTALVGAGLAMTLAEGWSVGGHFDGEFSDRVTGVAGSLDLKYRF